MADEHFGQNRRAAVVVNPTKVPNEAFKSDFFQLCADAGWDEPLWLETSEDDPGAGQAQEALNAGVDVVMAAGGDGTVRCVAQVLTGTKMAMSLVPLGTGNLLARNLGINVSDPLEAASEALAGTESKIDVITAVVDHGRVEQQFLVAAGLGYDAAIMGDTVDGLKDRVGWLAYVEAGIRHLPGKPVHATVTIDGQDPIRGSVRSVMVGNCGKLMGGIQIFPDATVTDGILDLLILAPKGKFGWLNVITRMFGKGHNQSGSVRSHPGKSAEIELDRPQEFQLDGDHVGKATHLKVSVDPLALIIRMTGSPDAK